MDHARLTALLPTRPIRYLPSVDSTMTQAKAWLDSDPQLPAGALVAADEQTQGRGRLGRAWLTPPGSALALSLILRGAAQPMNPIMAGALAIHQALDSFAPGQVSLKWPNDVLLGGRKVAGILAESLWQGERLQAIILGMGVNLTVNFTGSDLASTATSLTQHTDQPIDRAELLAQIVLGVERWLAAPDLWQHWKDRLVTLGQQVTINGGITGLAHSVQEDGALVVLLDSGQTQTVWAGDVGIL